MKILIINAILYTSESKKVKRADSIKDTMIYDLCLAFYKAGHEVTLCAAEPFRPKNGENYPFDVVWIQCKMENIFIPSRLPWMPAIKGYLKNNNFDLIISSEVFSLNTFYAYKICGDKVIAWHEIAKHQAMLHQIPSKFWYNIVAKHLLKNLHVVARSVEAREFIKKYCNNVEEEIIDHGVNLDKFKFNYDKEDYFVVCSQLIKRKRIDGIILKFNNFLSLFPEYKLVIIGGETVRKLGHD